MKRTQRKQSAGRGRLLVPALLVFLVAKIVLVGFSIQHRLEMPAWTSVAIAASDTEPSAEVKAPAAEEASPLRELLEKKDEQLRRKDQALQQKEAELLLLEKEVSAKLAELLNLKEKLTNDLAELEKREKALQDNRIKQLVGAYKAMEPAKAAKLLEKLDEHIAMQIIASMRGRAAGQILSSMETERAARISKRLSQADK